MTLLDELLQAITAVADVSSTRDIMLKSPWATRTSAQIRIGASANSSGKKKLDTILVDRMESESSEGH